MRCLLSCVHNVYNKISSLLKGCEKKIMQIHKGVLNVDPAFSPSRTFLLLTLCHTSTQTHPNPRRLHTHCFAIAVRHQARNRGDTKTKKEDPFCTFVHAYSLAQTHMPQIPKFCSILEPVTCVILASAGWFILLMCFFKGLIWLQLSVSLICFNVSCECRTSGTETDKTWCCWWSSKASYSLAILCLQYGRKWHVELKSDCKSTSLLSFHIPKNVLLKHTGCFIFV